MGMFDHLRCDYPLPNPAHNHLDYQTKDTEAQFLDLYIITTDGRLVHCTEALVPLTPEEKGDNKFPLCKRVPTGDVEVKHEGDLCFYGGDDSDAAEYIAFFQGGRVQWIKPAEEGLLISDGKACPRCGEALRLYDYEKPHNYPHGCSGYLLTRYVCTSGHGSFGEPRNRCWCGKIVEVKE